MKPSSIRRQAGATLVEILVSILILMFGLLGLVGVMVQSQRAQLESFQRQQALLLAQDMVQRMQVNKAVISCYVLASYVGKGNTTAPAASTCTSGTLSQQTRFNTDVTEWISQLLGAGELDASSSKVGGIPDARGCITKDATTGNYMVSVAWQGSIALSAPPTGVTCAQTLYNADGTDTARRVVSLAVLF